MPGERDLGELLAGMSPRRVPGEYVFASVRPDAVPAGLQPFARVRETEGLTLVLPRADADRTGLGYDFVAVLITLDVHSDLAAVGLTAAVSGVLAGAGISCNVIAGAFHDHLLVPADRADEAVRLLVGLRTPLSRPPERRARSRRRRRPPGPGPAGPAW